MFKWLRAEVVLGFFLASIFWAGVLGWQAAYAPSEIEKRECYEAAKRAGHKTDECKTFWERATSDPVALFTLVLAFSTIGLWVATVGLYFAGERQLAHFQTTAERQARDTEDSIAVARDAANAADKSAKIAEEAFRRLERPYLMIKIIETIRLTRPFDGGQPHLQYRLVNYGKLPAILRSISISLQNNPTLPLRVSMGIEETRYEVIAPGDELLNPRTVSVLGSAPDERFEGANATGLVLHGILQYEDPTGAFHTDGFCMRGLPSGHAFTIEGGPEHNWHKTEYPPPPDRPHSPA
jgi:hypothetical protein